MKPKPIYTQKPLPTVSFTLLPSTSLSEFKTKYTLATTADHDEIIRQNLVRRWKKLSTWAS